MATKYSFCPAGFNYRSQGLINIYIKYGRSNTFGVKHHSSAYTWIVTPEREIVFTTQESQFHPSEGTFDECVSLSPFNTRVSQDMGLDYMMVNYVDSIGREHRAHRTRKNGTPFETPPQIISDSGGFQLGMSRLDFINPYQYIDWANDNADLVMTLDYPILYDTPEMLPKLAQTHAANNKILLDNKRDDIELFNIFHGHDTPSMLKYRSIVETPEIDRLAVGGLYSGLFMNSVDRFIHLIRDGAAYKHIHLLGIANVVQLIPLMRTAVEEGLPLMTSDSSTHLQKGVNKDYFHFTTLHEPQRILHLNKPETPSFRKILPCNCPVCAAIKYSDVFVLLDGSLVLNLLAYHSMFNIVSYTNAMFAAVSTMNTPDLKELLTSHLRAKKSQSVTKELFTALDFIDKVKNDGYDKAKKAYRYYLNTGLDFTAGLKDLMSDDERAIVMEPLVDEDGNSIPSVLNTDPIEEEEDTYAIRDRHAQRFIDNCAKLDPATALEVRKRAKKGEKKVVKGKSKHPGHRVTSRKQPKSSTEVKASVKAKNARDAKKKVVGKRHATDETPKAFVIDLTAADATT